jgi:uncharacterized protein
MGRLLFLALVVLAGVWLVRRALGGGAAAGGPPPRAAEDLVRCAQCGLLLPRAEARVAGGATYCSARCSEDHARRGPRAS